MLEKNEARTGRLDADAIARIVCAAARALKLEIFPELTAEQLAVAGKKEVALATGLVEAALSEVVSGVVKSQDAARTFYSHVAAKWGWREWAKLDRTDRVWVNFAVGVIGAVLTAGQVTEDEAHAAAERN